MQVIENALVVESRSILGQRVDATSYRNAVDSVLSWSIKGESRYVCVANVHVLMEGWDNAAYRQVINEGDLVTPDGMPLVFGLRALGVSTATRVYGPTLTLAVCQRFAAAGVPIALYGGTAESLMAFKSFLFKRFPEIQIPCAIAPPFRPLTAEEDTAYTEAIESSGAGVLLVGIGCPKQEKWMAAHRGRIFMPMLGVGAAFDFHAGRVKQAPPWMQRISMEWFFRLMMEPRRLWRRYLWHNPRFILLFAWQISRRKLCK